MTTEQMDEKDGPWETPVIQSTTPVPAGRLFTDDGREIDLDEPAPDLDPEQHFGHEPYWVERTTDAITDTTQFSEDTLFKVDAALFEAGINGVNARRDLISAMQNAGILFRERVTDAEEHTHHTREARDQCAAGDHQYAKLLDDAAEREKVLRDRAEVDEGEREKMFESRAASLDWLWKRGVIDEQRHHELRQQLREEFGYYREPVESDVTTMAEEPIENRLRRAWLNGFKEGVDRAAFATQEATGRWDY